MRPYILCVLAALSCTASSQSRAAEAYSACTGYIDELPAVITGQGTWCLRQDLATAITGGSAISVNANNVTIDCNHFKVGGLAAGIGSSARGVYAWGRSNTTIRNCTIRGFDVGILLGDEATSGALVEHNRLDGNLRLGIQVQGDGSSVVRRNRVIDTGGKVDPGITIAIYAFAHILDNTVDGVFADNGDGFVRGIYLPLAAGPGRVVRGNRVRGLSPHGNGLASAILSEAHRTHIIGNHVAGSPVTGNSGVFNNGAAGGFNRDNTVAGFDIPFFGTAVDGGGNVSN